jgi:hypothetical protein
MSTNTFGTPLTDSSVVGKSGLRARESGVLMSSDQWAVGALRITLERVRTATIKEHMRRAAEIGAAPWR